MLMKMLMTADTFDRYCEQVKKRNIVFGAMTVLGLLMSSGGVYSAMSQLIQNDHHAGFISGIGVGIGLAGVLFLIQNQKVLKDEKKLRKQWIEEKDERNQLIGTKTISAAAGWTFGCIYLALVVSFFINLTVFVTLAAVVGVTIASVVCCRLYYERKI